MTNHKRTERRLPVAPHAATSIAMFSVMALPIVWATGIDLIPAGTVARIWQLMFGLQDPLGRLINEAILALFAVAVLDLVVAGVRITSNRRWLRRAERGIAAFPGRDTTPPDVEAFLIEIGLTAAAEGSLVAQRVRNLFSLRAKRVLDVGVLKEISGERVSLHGGFSRFVAGTLTVLGLVGTVLGLSAAIDRLLALAEQVKASGEIGPFLDQVLQTLGGMKTAFSCTLTGLVSSVILSVLNYIVQRAQAGFFIELESFANTDLVPAIVPVPADHAAEEFVAQLHRAGEHLSTTLDRVDGAAAVFADGATALGAATGNMGQAVQVLMQKAETFTTSAEALKEGTDALKGVRDLPSSLQHVLSEAMRQAAESVQQRQDQLSTDYLSRVDRFFREVSESQQRVLGEKMDVVADSARSLSETAAMLQGIRDLPLSLQQALGEAMAHAAGAVQARQEKAADAYLGRVEKFFGDVSTSHEQVQRSYADLVMGVQLAVGEMLARHADRQDEMVRELRSLNAHLALPAPRPGGPLAAPAGGRDGQPFWRRASAADARAQAPSAHAAGAKTEREAGR